MLWLQQCGSPYAPIPTSCIAAAADKQRRWQATSLACLWWPNARMLLSHFMRSRMHAFCN